MTTGFTLRLPITFSVFLITAESTIETIFFAFEKQKSDAAISEAEEQKTVKLAKLDEQLQAGQITEAAYSKKKAEIETAENKKIAAVKTVGQRRRQLEPAC